MTQDVVLRKYPQRRLYDAGRRKFLTLSDIAGLVKAGAAVSARDALDRDITSEVLCQVILKQETESISAASPLSSELLRQLIRLAQQPSQPALPLYLEHLSKLLESVPTGATEPQQSTAAEHSHEAPPSSLDDDIATEVEHSYAGRLLSPLKE